MQSVRMLVHDYAAKSQLWPISEVNFLMIPLYRRSPHVLSSVGVLWRFSVLDWCSETSYTLILRTRHSFYFVYNITLNICKFWQVLCHQAPGR